MTLRKTLGTDWADWLPAIRSALGCAGRFYLSPVTDPRLLRLGMAVMFLRRPLPSLPDDPQQIPCYAGPSVPPADLPALARRLREPVALLRAIRAAYAEPIYTWLRDSSPVLAGCYADAAINGGRIPLPRLPGPVVPRRDGRHGPHRLAAEWSRAGDGLAVLQPCRCGSVRRAVMLLREVTGTLCLDCRTDRASVRWDASYDRFIDGPAADARA